MLYCRTMIVTHTYWPRWASILRRFHVANLASSLLEGGRPLTFLAAQLAYCVQPFLGTEQLNALAATLEDDVQASAFARFLTED